jgi:hypothetical protein
MGRFLAIVWLSACAWLAAAPPQASEFVETGNELYRQGRFEEAGLEYRKASKVSAPTPELSYNLGNVYFQQFRNSRSDTRATGDAELAKKAIESYQEAVRSPSASLRAKALYNLANTYALSGEPQRAIDHYRESLRLAPGDTDAKHNLELLLARASKSEAGIDELNSITMGLTEPAPTPTSLPSPPDPDEPSSIAPVATHIISGTAAGANPPNPGPAPAASGHVTPDPKSPDSVLKNADGGEVSGKRDWTGPASDAVRSKSQDW